MPKYSEIEGDPMAEDTPYVDSEYQLTSLAIEETMITLFGFSNHIHSNF